MPNEIEPTEAVAGGRLVHQCGAQNAKGVPCGLRMVSWVEGEGWRCRHHRAKAAAVTPAAPATPTEPDAQAPVPPVTTVETWQDAAKLLGWVAVQLASGTELSQARASGISTALREWRQARIEIVKWQTVQAAIHHANA